MLVDYCRSGWRRKGRRGIARNNQQTADSGLGRSRLTEKVVGTYLGSRVDGNSNT